MQIQQPVRATRTFVQRIVAGPEQVFPLLCPVREADWIEGWDPRLVVSDSGLAERDCVFVTDSSSEEAIWYITRHEPERGFVEMVKITPQVTACRLTIQLRAAEVDGQAGCEATVSYSHTSLGPEGDAFVAGFSEEFYEGFMKDWEGRLNHFLRHGSALSGERGDLAAARPAVV
jgi:hypothetical protein